MGTGRGGGGGMFLVGFPQEGTLVLCWDSTPKMDINLCYRLLDLVDCFDLLCGMGGDDMSSLCVPPGLSSRDLSQLSLSDTGVLDVTGVRFDVSGASLSCEGDSVQFGSSLMMSDDTGYGDWFPLITAARSGSGRCGWLQFMSQGVGPVSPPINKHSHTVVLNRKGRKGVVYVRIVHTQWESVGVLQVACRFCR